MTAPLLVDRPALAEIKEFARSSPARLLAIGMVLILLCAAAGIYATQETVHQQNSLNTLLDDSEPFLHSTERVYNSLSTADAAAATSFIFGGLAPREVRNRYAQAIGEASADLADDADEDSTGTSRQLRRSLAAQIPVYAELVETARANDRSGHPLGAAYLGEASHLMQTAMLPMAQDLHNRQSASVAATQRHFDSPPWTTILLLALILTGLIRTQFHLANRWRRRFNPGMLAATTAMFVLFVWVTVAGTISAVATGNALKDGTTPLGRLSESRILVQQARTDETLKLVRHDTSTEYDKPYDDAVRRLRELLGGYPADAPGAAQVTTASTALGRWLTAHQHMSAAADTGDFNAATTMAIGPGPNEIPAQFAAVDNALQQSIAATRNELRSDVRRAAHALDLLGKGSLLLALSAAAAIGLGMWPRLREYR